MAWPGYEAGMGDGTTLVATAGKQVIGWAYLPYGNDSAAGRYVNIVFPPEQTWGRGS